MCFLICQCGVGIDKSSVDLEIDFFPHFHKSYSDCCFYNLSDTIEIFGFVMYIYIYNTEPWATHGIASGGFSKSSLRLEPKSFFHCRLALFGSASSIKETEVLNQFDNCLNIRSFIKVITIEFYLDV